MSFNFQSYMVSVQFENVKVTICPFLRGQNGYSDKFVNLKILEIMGLSKVGSLSK